MRYKLTHRQCEKKEYVHFFPNRKLISHWKILELNSKVLLWSYANSEYALQKCLAFQFKKSYSKLRIQKSEKKTVLWRCKSTAIQMMIFFQLRIVCLGLNCLNSSIYFFELRLDIWNVYAIECTQHIVQVKRCAQLEKIIKSEYRREFCWFFFLSLEILLFIDKIHQRL